MASVDDLKLTITSRMFIIMKWFDDRIIHNRTSKEDDAVFVRTKRHNFFIKIYTSHFYFCIWSSTWWMPNLANGMFRRPSISLSQRTLIIWGSITYIFWIQLLCLGMLNEQHFFTCLIKSKQEVSHIVILSPMVSVLWPEICFLLLFNYPRVVHMMKNVASLHLLK